MSGAGPDDPVLLFSWRGCLFRVSDGVQPPKAGSLFFCRHLHVRPGARVTATDIVPGAIDSIRVNAALNSVAVDARLGDGWDPVVNERFDLVCTNPPQMPTPAGRDRDDAEAAADNGGADGWALLD